VRALCSVTYSPQCHQKEQQQYIQELKERAQLTPDNELETAIQDVQSEVEKGKQLVGCKLSDDQINIVVERFISGGDGYICLSKRHLDRWFDNFAYVFPRWPHIPGHALVQFDSNIDGESPCKLFLAELVL